MPDLTTTPNLRNADDFYAALLAAHEGLDEAQMSRLNARLVLTLANHIGDLDVLDQALKVARGAVQKLEKTDPTKA